MTLNSSDERSAQPLATHSVVDPELVELATASPGETANGRDDTFVAIPNRRCILFRIEKAGCRRVELIYAVSEKRIDLGNFVCEELNSRRYRRHKQPFAVLYAAVLDPVTHIACPGEYFWADSVSVAVVHGGIVAATARQTVFLSWSDQMKHVMCCGLAVLALSVSAGAQDHKMDSMKPEMTYTGCLERSPEGAITLAHAMVSNGAAKKPMSKDAMAHDSMSTDAMAPTFTLSSTSVDLAKHVGHKVSVKGVAGETMNNMAAFTVKSMKMVATSCK